MDVPTQQGAATAPGLVETQRAVQLLEVSTLQWLVLVLDRHKGDRQQHFPLHLHTFKF